jgi:pyruvate-formate lyase-activating enzyme
VREMLRCPYCHNILEEYVTYDFKNKKQIKKFECIVHGLIEVVQVGDPA